MTEAEKREKVMRGLECCAFGSLSDCEGCPYYIETKCSELVCGDALALLKEQEARWIPVTERLPEDDTIVLVVSQLYHYPYPAFQIGGVWYDGYLVACQAENDMDDDWTIDESGITHWMPLPEPPKEEEA